MPLATFLSKFFFVGHFAAFSNITILTSQPLLHHIIAPTTPMKNKSTLLALPFAAAVLCAPSVFAAPPPVPSSLLFGFHNFDGTTNDETRDAGVAGFAGALLSKSGATSGASLGSTDNRYGTLNGVNYPTSGANSWVNPSSNNGYLILPSGSSVSIVVTNLSGFDYTLERFLFDYSRSDNSSVNLSVTYAIDTDTPASFPSTPLTSSDVVGNDEDYGDLTSVINFNFPSQSTLTILFDNIGANTMFLDNIGLIGLQGAQDLTIIPEPGSMLALGCILTSGLALRSRRRAVKAS